MNVISNRLKSLRKEKDVMQKDVANFLGISSSAYGFYEQGKRTPTSDIIVKLAKYFDVSTDYLLGKTDKRNYQLNQFLGRANRLMKSENLTSSNLNKDDLKYMIQNMVDKIDNAYILKQAFFSIYNQLDMHELIDKDSDKDLIQVKNILAHSKPSDEEFKDLLKLYKNNRILSK